MPFNTNFTRITLGTDPATGAKALFVEGASNPAGEATEIFVSLPHGGELLSAPVDDAGLENWEAKFLEGGSPFQLGEDVFVVGVAMRTPPHDPVVWHGSFKSLSRANA
jgi:hypothetical protein